MKKRGFVGAGILVVFLIGGILSPLASTSPDGLERTALDLGFYARQQTTPWSPLANYTVSMISQPFLSASLAGILGTSLTLSGMWIFTKWLIRRKRNREG